MAIYQLYFDYFQDFTIQTLERRLARLMGEVDTEEKRELEAKIVELTKTLEAKTGVQTMLTAQLKRLQDDIRRQKRDMEKSGAEKSDLTSKIEELNLHNEISNKELRNIINKSVVFVV